jgi:putative ABC transport system substrate-binding protein
VISRRAFLGSLGGALVVAPLAAKAQPTGNVWRIGLVSVAYLRDEDIFFQRLRELGYVEGQNLVVERRYSAPRWLESVPTRSSSSWMA